MPVRVCLCCGKRMNIAALGNPNVCAICAQLLQETAPLEEESIEDSEADNATPIVNPDVVKPFASIFLRPKK